MPISVLGTAAPLILGLAAWALGLATLLLRRKWNTAQLCGMGSLACCAASLDLVVFGLAHYADIEDISAFLDTAGAFRFCSGVLLAGTLILNGAALALHARKRPDRGKGGAK